MTIELPPVVPSEELPENHPPMRLSGLKPLRVLRGGMSIVYLCDADQSFMDATEVAVKRLRPEVLSVSGSEVRFLRECYFWLQLGEHKNVVRALSAHQAAFEAPLLVLEYIPYSLRTAMIDISADLLRTLHTLIGVVDGLTHVRATLPGFVHGDLKPENILLSADGTAKITDLGLANALAMNEAVSFKRGSDSANSTEISDIVNSKETVSAPLASGYVRELAGTPLYMAPEQIIAGRAIPESDVYALGCIAYELVSGRPPYGLPTSAAECLLRHLHSKPLPIGTGQYPLPLVLRTLIDSMLAKNPTDRPKLDHVRDVLRQAIADEWLDVPVPVPLPPDKNRQFTAAQGLCNIGLLEEARELAQKSTVGLGAADAIRPRLLVAGIHTMQGRPDMALQELDEVAESLDEETDLVLIGSYYTERARAESNTGNLPAAARSAVQAIEALPGYSRVYANAAVIFDEMGELEKAITLVKRALSISVDLTYFSGLANLLCKANRWEEAMAICDRMVECHPTVGVSYAHRAATRIRMYTAVGIKNQFESEALKNATAIDCDRARRYGSLPPEVEDAIAAFTTGWE